MREWWYRTKFWLWLHVGIPWGNKYHPGFAYRRLCYYLMRFKWTVRNKWWRPLRPLNERREF